MRAPLQARNDSDAVPTKIAGTATQDRRLVDNRPAAVAQGELMNTMNGGPVGLQQRALRDAIHDSPRMVAQRHEMNALFGGAVEPQGNGAMPAGAPLAQHEEKTDNTGLPDQLKSGIESLSGTSMDHVKVHYNSKKPAQLQAHAYAQGSEIHLGTGQERHLPHEAWHIVQQAQGRVQPTLQMKAGVVNADAALEQEADIFGEKATQMGAGHAPLSAAVHGEVAELVSQRVLDSAPPGSEPLTKTNYVGKSVIQRKFESDLSNLNDTEILEEVVKRLKVPQLKIYLLRVQLQKLREGEKVYRNIDELLAVLSPPPARHSENAPAPAAAALDRMEVPSGRRTAETLSKISGAQGSGSSATSSPAINRSAEDERASGSVVLARAPDQPATLAAIAKASKEAQLEAIASSSPQASPKASSAAPEEKAPEPPPTHKTVAAGGKKVIVNYVWLGSRPLGPLEKLNVHSWSALGHQVNIFTHRFGSHAKRTIQDLGLQEGDATIIDLQNVLGGDEKEATTSSGADNHVKAASASVMGAKSDEAQLGGASSSSKPASDHELSNASPKAILGDARVILRSWLVAATEEPNSDFIFNVVDLTKSYLGGTRRGIVLDMKVGPSVHLEAYAEAFRTNLISYTRGGNTAAGLPENQSMGTMQRTDDLRRLYATNFNKRIKDLKNSNPDKKLFDLITGYHGQSYEETKMWLNVAEKTPSGGGESQPRSQDRRGEPGST